MKRIVYAMFVATILLLVSCSSNGYEVNESNPVSSGGSDSPNQPIPPAGTGGNASQNNTAFNNEGIFIPSGPGNPPDGILEQLSWYGGGGGLTARACGECQVYIDGNSLIVINFKPYQRLTLVFYRNITGLNFCGYGTSEFVTMAYIQVDENGSLTIPITGALDGDYIRVNTVIDTDTGFVEIPGSTKLEPACISATQTADAKLPLANDMPDSTNKSALCSKVTVNVTDTTSGDVLHLQCSNWTYDTPPLAKGIYAVDPDNLFVVYCSFTGDLYVVKIGDPSLVFIENLSARMPAFVAGDVQLKISFSKEDIHHYVTIQDLNSGQETTIKIPLSASQ